MLFEKEIKKYFMIPILQNVLKYTKEYYLMPPSYSTLVFADTSDVAKKIQVPKDH